MSPFEFPEQIWKSICTFILGDTWDDFYTFVYERSFQRIETLTDTFYHTQFTKFCDVYTETARVIEKINAIETTTLQRFQHNETKKMYLWNRLLTGCKKCNCEHMDHHIYTQFVSIFKQNQQSMKKKKRIFFKLVLI
uniref:Uncharacterized protein n=1 Tax=viral metagenome TaxID=1070528 RepID=A0A6C0CRW9_9ZZZZ